jgi:hypothetical protein
MVDRDQVIGVSVTKDTKQRLEEAADEAALNTSAFIRHKIKTKVLKDGETA